MLTIKTDYEKAVMEVNEMLKYVYPDRKENENHLYQGTSTPIINNDISFYA